MGSVEQVCALPGGGAFAEIWEQVDGDAATITEAAAALIEVADGVQAAQRRVGAATAGVADGWRGSAATAFEHYMSKVGSASANVEQTLHQTAAELRGAGAAIDEAKEQVRRVADGVLDAVRQADALAQRDPDVELAPLVSHAVADGVTRAQPIAAALSDRLTAVAAAVRTAGNVGGYSALREPGTYLPPPGGRIDWSAVPKAGESGSTRPASTGAGTGAAAGAHPGPAGTSGGPPLAPPSGSVKTWIAQAIEILERNGYRADQLDPAAINTIIQHESSGNPRAENDWDSNAKAGHPSKGLMQCIDSTFDAHALPGHRDIWNPVDNIIAGVRYAISRYGSIDEVPGIKAVHAGGSYVGY